MPNYKIPTIGSEGYFVLISPLDNLIGLNELYTCKGIRNISEYIANNEDVKTNIYDKYLLPTIDYEEDLDSDSPIVSLQSQKGHWLYIPARYFSSYPIINGIKYSTKVLSFQLPAMPVDQNLSGTINDIRQLIMDRLGVDSIGKDIETSRVTLVPKNKHMLETAVRNGNKDGSYSYLTMYNKLKIIYQLALDKIQALEGYLLAHLFVTQPYITHPTNNSTDLNPTITFTASPFAVTGGNDVHVSTDWEIYDDASLSTLITSSVNDIINLESWDVSGLLPNVDYWVRVKYNAQTFGSSQWSTPIKFNNVQIALPIITSPVNNSVHPAPNVSFTSSVFNASGVDTHESTDWELYAEASLSTLIASSIGDTVNKVSWTVGGLSAGNDYYLRIRYNGTLLGHSQWSTVIRVVMT